MTPPRAFPDRPRFTGEQRTWAIAARHAGATLKQIAVGIGGTESGVGRMLRATNVGIPPAVRDTWRCAAEKGQAKLRAAARVRAATQLVRCAEAEAAHVPVYRCECGGYRATPPDGVCVHGQRTREGVAA